MATRKASKKKGIRSLVKDSIPDGGIATIRKKRGDEPPPREYLWITIPVPPEQEANTVRWRIKRWVTTKLLKIMGVTYDH